MRKPYRLIAAAVLAAGLAVASAQNPPAPTWPKEFTATLTIVDFRHQRNESSDYAYSTSNLAELNDFTRFRNMTWVDLHDYKDKVHYEAIEGAGGRPQCRQQPERNNFPIPPVNTFTYNGTHTFPDGTQYYSFVDPQYANFEYLCTADANEYPIAFFDRQNQVAQEFRDFTPVTNWPANTFAKPQGC